MKVDVFYLVKLKLKTPSFLWQTFTIPIKTIPVFFKNFFKKLITFSAKDLIIEGDFNLILNNTLDKIGGPKHKNAQARNSVILKIFSALNIRWQNLSPESNLIHLQQLNLIFFWYHNIHAVKLEKPK